MRSRTLGIVAAIGLGATFVVMLAVPAIRESQTQDEAVYVVSGLSYWKTGDFRLNPEHPPLVKELLALPVLFRGATFRPESADWTGASEWDVSPKVLYHNVVPGPNLLLLARCITIVFTLGLVVLGAAWSKRMFGWGAAWLATLLLMFEPNVLAFGHLATTDVAYTLAVLGSIFTFGLMLERPTIKRTIVSAAVFSAALLTRFNALLLIILLPTLYVTAVIVRRGKWNLSFRLFFRTVGIFILVAFLGIWAAYGFEIRPLDQVQDRPAIEELNGHQTVVQFFERTPLPAMSYLSGLLYQTQHNRGGQPGYLFGQISDTGWWYYGLAALLVKMTLASFALVLVAVFARKRHSEDVEILPIFSQSYLLVAFFVLTVSSFYSQLAIGVRYLLPSIVLLIMLASGAVRKLWHRSYSRYLLVVLVGYHVVSVVRIFPHWLPYANEAFGGPGKLERSLIDSNLDWGQDIPLIRAYMLQHGIAAYRYQSFSTASAAAYGVTENEIPTDAQVVNHPFVGVIAIGKSVLLYPGNPYTWLRRLTPTAVLGYSTNVYDLRYRMQ